MKPSFHHRPVNGPFEDPVVFVRILRDRRALLFDAGDVSGLSTRDLMKITDVFVTHTHIDHFIGFDTIIRILLRRDTPVTFYGPEGIIDRIQGKLRGYTWNLITEYPLVIRVLEIRNENVHKATFKAGEYVAQMIVRTFVNAQIEMVEGGFDETERGDGGFGSTDK